MGVSAQVAAASRIIERFGRAGTLRQIENAGDPWAPIQFDVDHAVTVAIVEYAQEVRDGTLIGKSDLRALMSAYGLTVTPTTADKLIVGGITYTVARVSPAAPDGVALFWELQVRT